MLKLALQEAVLLPATSAQQGLVGRAGILVGVKERWEKMFLMSTVR